MSFAPLLDAAPAIPVHAFAAMTAFVLGLVQFAAPKGTLPHRTLGWIWVALMLAAAISSFWIHQIRLVGPWSPIHLLSILVLVSVPLAVWKAHHHRVADHRRIMTRFSPARWSSPAVHAVAGTDHACGDIRPLDAGTGPRAGSFGHPRQDALSPLRTAGSVERRRVALTPPKSLEKRREKLRARSS